jgi:hypothetical protein
MFCNFARAFGKMRETQSGTLSIIFPNYEGLGMVRCTISCFSVY